MTYRSCRSLTRRAIRAQPEQWQRVLTETSFTSVRPMGQSAQSVSVKKNQQEEEEEENEDEKTLLVEEEEKEQVLGPLKNTKL